MIEYYDMRKRFERILVISLAIIAVVYGVFRAYPLLAGPSITIYSPHDGDYVASSTFEISGRVLRATAITLSGRPITIDTEGYFKETLVAQYPYTILVLIATDSYGARMRRVLRVIPQ